MARLYANKNFALPVALELRRLCHDVLTMHEAGRSDQSIPDEEVLEFAAAENRAALTLNRKHFIHLYGDICDPQGIIVCTYDPNSAKQTARINAVVQEQAPLSGNLLHVIRPPN